MKKKSSRPNPSEQLLSRRAVASRWGVSVETVKRREADAGLRAMKFNPRLVRYRLSDILAFEETFRP
jgi:hypothetical protein